MGRGPMWRGDAVPIIARPDEARSRSAHAIAGPAGIPRIAGGPGGAAHPSYARPRAANAAVTAFWAGFP